MFYQRSPMHFWNGPLASCWIGTYPRCAFLWKDFNRRRVPNTAVRFSHYGATRKHWTRQIAGFILFARILGETEGRDDAERRAGTNRRPVSFHDRNANSGETWSAVEPKRHWPTAPDRQGSCELHWAHRTGLQHLIHKRELVVVRNGRRVHLYRADLDRWIEANKV